MHALPFPHETGADRRFAGPRLGDRRGRRAGLARTQHGRPACLAPSGRRRRHDAAAAADAARGAARARAGRRHRAARGGTVGARLAELAAADARPQGRRHVEHRRRRRALHARLDTATVLALRADGLGTNELHRPRAARAQTDDRPARRLSPTRRPAAGARAPGLPAGQTRHLATSCTSQPAPPRRAAKRPNTPSTRRAAPSPRTSATHRPCRWDSSTRPRAAPLRSTRPTATCSDR